MERNWTPIKSGKLYCSPACGGGCTHSAYLTAVKKAKALAKKCEKEIGGKWEISVHENLGWHYEVRMIGANISVDYGGYLAKGNYYTASFIGGTPCHVSTHPQTFKTPKAAFDAQMNLVRKESDRWISYLETIKNALGKTLK